MRLKEEGAKDKWVDNTNDPLKETISVSATSWPLNLLKPKALRSLQNFSLF
jgi:hypothetical protein